MKSEGTFVTILRHGKAEKESASGFDADRELRAKGRQQAEFVGQRLAWYISQGMFQMCHVVSSPAVRAMSTAQAVCDVLGRSGILDIDKRLMTNAALNEHIAVLEERANMAAREATGRAGKVGIVIVGHNPTFSELAMSMTKPLTNVQTELRTGEACVLRFAQEVAVGQGKLVERVRIDQED